MCGYVGACGGRGEDGGVVRDMCQVLQTVLTREEDGSQWMGYVRLRGCREKAVKAKRQDGARERRYMYEDSCFQDQFLTVDLCTS